MRLNTAGGAVGRNLVRFVDSFLPALLCESVVQIPHRDESVVCTSFKFLSVPTHPHLPSRVRVGALTRLGL